MSEKVTINKLATGVPGLDAILGGGLPEFSLNVITGPSGSGKTTLAHQIMFALATPERPALYFTLFGESPLKMLRYQQQFSFFSLEQANESIRFIHLADIAAMGNLPQLLARILDDVKTYTPGLVFVDSFCSLLFEACQHEKNISQQQFIQQLGLHLSSWQTTAFLIGEFQTEGASDSATTAADGLICLSQSFQQKAVLRKLLLVKMRGQAAIPGLHPFRITQDGISAFPGVNNLKSDTRTKIPAKATPTTRLAMGIPHLDSMLGGGLPSGYSLLVTGPPGSGKTTLASAFLAEGVRRGELGVRIDFDQAKKTSWNYQIDEMIADGKIGVININLPDLSIDEILQGLIDLIHQMKATRVVLDSLPGLKLAVAHSFEGGLPELLFRINSVLFELGVTALLTMESEDFNINHSHGLAFLADALIVLSYIGSPSCLKRAIAVTKVRQSAHSDEIRPFEILDGDMYIRDPMQGLG